MTGFYIILLSALALLGLFSWFASRCHWFDPSESDGTAATEGGREKKKKLKEASSESEEEEEEESGNHSNDGGNGSNSVHNSNDSGNGSNDGEICCGQHLVCQKDKRLMSRKDIVYFDDEELDDFRDTPAENYSDEALALFSEIFHTVRPEEMMDWLNSLRLRRIELPIELRDEALLIVSEQRSEI